MNYLAKRNDENRTLSLETHLADTVYVMKNLLDTYCSDSVFKASGMDEDVFRSIAVFVASIHDIGKATPIFQKKINGEDIPFHHALAGAAILYQKFNVSKEICDIIAAHHGKTRSNSVEENFSYYFKKNMKLFGSDVEYWSNLFSVSVEKSGHSLDLSYKVPVTGQMLLTGLLIMADWIASNEDYFSLCENEVNSLDSDLRGKCGMKALSLPEGWDPCIYQMDVETFEERFGFKPNEFQSDVIEIVNQISVPGIMILEAPMGVGKTEAALATSEVFATKSACGGLYYGLPTKGTANGMLPRMVSWARSTTDGMQASFRLAHSDAKNNSEYRSLCANIDDESGITVNTWLSGRHRALLADFGIGTVDQVLMAGLLKKFVMLLHLGISKKVIIIDEVHAYDAYMSSYLNVVLKWAGAYQIPVILLSATLPVQKKKEFIQAYTGSDVFPDLTGYPCITWSDEDIVRVKNLFSMEDEKDVFVDYVDTSTGIKQIVGQDNCCVGVIVNSVNRAQLLYEQIKSELSNRNVVLIHSRFLAEDRNRKENEVLRYAGKESTSDLRSGTVIIGTQVLEQSLDIDFDILYTDKCPIDLFLQRIGREFRHVRSNRPVNRACCYIFDDKRVEHITKKYIYRSAYLIDETDKSLKDGVVKIPKDIRRLTEQVYDLTKTSNSLAKEQFKTMIKSLQSNAKSYLIADPKHAVFAGMMDNDTDAENGVRYGHDSAEVLFLKKFDDGAIGSISGSVRITDNPSYMELNRIMNQTITIPHYMLDFEMIESRSDELPDWLKSDLFKHKPIILFASDNTYVDSKNIYTYDEICGFRCIKKG